MVTPLGIVASAWVDPWTPALLPNKALWLDASNVASLPAVSPVPTWSDVSGLGRNYTAAGALQPTREATGLNGKPCVRFDGTHQMARAAFAPSLTNWLIAAVVRTDSSQPTSVRGYFFLGDNSHVGVSQLSEGTQWYASIYGGIGWANYSPAKVDYWDLQVCHRDGTNTQMRSKKVQQGGNLGGAPNAASGITTIGGDSYGTKTKCRVSEIVVVSGAWTTTDRDKLESYLMTKWSL